MPNWHLLTKEPAKLSIKEVQCADQTAAESWLASYRHTIMHKVFFPQLTFS